MDKFIKSISGIVAIGSMIFMASCKSNTDYAGVWETKSPVDVTIKMPPATSATSVTTINIQNDQQLTGGPVKLSNRFDIVDKDSLGAPITVTGVASIDGKWQVDVDDEDDVLMSFDMSTMKVELKGDSAKVAAWKPEVERLFREDVARYSVVEDVELKDNGKLMSLEINNPETKVFFDRVEP